MKNDYIQHLRKEGWRERESKRGVGRQLKKKKKNNTINDQKNRRRHVIELKKEHRQRMRNARRQKVRITRTIKDIK